MIDRRTLAIIAAVVVAAVVALILVYYPGFYLPFFFLFIPLGIFGRRKGTVQIQEDDDGYCPECGNQIGPDDEFCHICGAMLRR